MFHLQKDVPDVKSDFGEFRSRVLDLIKDSAFMIGSNNLFLQVSFFIRRSFGLFIWFELNIFHFVICSCVRRFFTTWTKLFGLMSRLVYL